MTEEKDVISEYKSNWEERVSMLDIVPKVFSADILLSLKMEFHTLDNIICHTEGLKKQWSGQGAYGYNIFGHSSTWPMARQL